VPVALGPRIRGGDEWEAYSAAASVAVCQDRAAEKALFMRCGVPCAPYAVIETATQLTAVSDDLLPGILKTARMGYDGKGQVRVSTRAELATAWAGLKNVACVGGSWVTPASAVQAGDWAKIEALARDAAELAKALSQGEAN